MSRGLRRGSAQGTVVLGAFAALSVFASGAAAQVPDPTQVTGTVTQSVSNLTQQTSGTLQPTSSPTQTVQNTTSGASQTLNNTTSNTAQKVQNTTSGATQPVKQATSDATQPVRGGGGGGGPVRDVASQTGSAAQPLTLASSGTTKSGTRAVAGTRRTARPTSRGASVVIPNARPIPATCGQALRSGPIAFAHWMATFKGLGGATGYGNGSSGTVGGEPFTGGPAAEKAPQAVPKVPLPEAPSESDGRVLTLWLIIGAVLLAAVATYLSGQQMVTGSWNPFRRD